MVANTRDDIIHVSFSSQILLFDIVATVNSLTHVEPLKWLRRPLCFWHLFLSEWLWITEPLFLKCPKLSRIQWILISGDGHKLSILDPLDGTNDVGKSTFALTKIAFSKAFHILRRRFLYVSRKRKLTFLEAFFEVVGRSFKVLWSAIMKNWRDWRILFNMYVPSFWETPLWRWIWSELFLLPKLVVE